jgi:hypothetical protein
MRHLDAYHKEVLEKLEKEGLDRSTKKRVWIYPDYSNNTYTLTKPMPEMTASPLEHVGVILSMTPPRRVAATPSPVPEQAYDTLKPKPRKGKFVPFNAANVASAASAAAASVPKPTGHPKTWAKTEKPEVSFSQVMNEQKEEDPTTHASAEYVRPVHYAQTDMRKEKQCSYGKSCVKRDRPFACALNHDGLGDIIKRGTELTEEILCSFERPPFKRCGDGRCTKIHLEHRADFIEQKKKQFFDADPQANMSYSSVAGALKKEKAATAIITTSAEGTTIMMTREEALDVAAALQKLDKEHQQELDKQSQDEAEWNQPRNPFKVHSEKTADDDEENTDVEDDEDLDDPAIFAARAAKINYASSASS